MSELPPEPGAESDSNMGEVPNDLPPDSDLPDNDQELGDEETPETEEEVDDGEA